MLFKLYFALHTLFKQVEATKEISKQTAEELKQAQDANELSRLTTILSIALITLLVLLTISLIKNNKLQNENKRLRNN